MLKAKSGPWKAVWVGVHSRRPHQSQDPGMWVGLLFDTQPSN